MPRPIPYRRQPGFTTIESLIASVVFLVGLIGLLSALVQARGATGQARRILQATDIANDLMAQLQMWPFDDARLIPASGPCATDPEDEEGVLAKGPGHPGYESFMSCLHGEHLLRLNGARFGGLEEPVFTDSSGDQTRFRRYYIVRPQEVRPGVRRMQLWVKVLYEEGGQTRVVATQTMRVQMGGVL
jgi:hypothetical protein